MDLTDLSRFRARIEPLPAPYLEGTERRREEAVRPVHLPRHEIVGAGPVGRRGTALVDVAHELRPCRRDDAAAARIVHDAPLQIVSNPDAGHDLRCEAHEPGV